MVTSTESSYIELNLPGVSGKKRGKGGIFGVIFGADRGEGKKKPGCPGLLHVLRLVPNEPFNSVFEGILKTGPDGPVIYL